MTSRVVVQDGQTIGLAGLIRDSVDRGNQGIPWLKDVPCWASWPASRTTRGTRTELLVLITPHVIHDQRDARALTEDLRDQLINAAAVPTDLQRLRPSGSPDPQQQLRRRVRCRAVRHGLALENGGWGGIRTHGGLAPTAVFKTAALNHSATHPDHANQALRTRRSANGARVGAQLAPSRLAFP